VTLKHAALILGIALIIAGSPAFASAADTRSGPIHIDNLQIFRGDTAGGNEYTSPATHIAFVLEIDGYVVDRFEDAGSFAPGVTFNHRFAENQPRDDMRVVVEQASFADGSVWYDHGAVHVNLDRF
jgi:hypothetical protein